VLARGDAVAGKQKSATCTACHGETGHSIDPNYPALAGQYQDYLVKALSDYRSGKRTNVIMAGFAAQLSNQDIEDLAAWFSSQQGLVDLKIK
jgi:cytochrome c553